MNKIITKTILALVGLMMFATTAVAQSTPPAGTPCITMTVKYNATVQIRMQAAADNTPVWVKTTGTGSSSYTSVTVGTGWTDFVNYTANGTTIRVYGNLKGFDCRDNSTNLTKLTFSDGLTNLQALYCQNNSLTTLDVSELTNLRYLVCYSNNFSTLAIDNIYCGLPLRLTSDNAVIKPVYNSSSDDLAIVLATNKQNAIDKNWKVQYQFQSNSTDLPATTGSYECSSATPPPTGTPYITMTVTNNATVQIDMKAAAYNTPVWVETSEGNYTLIIVGTGWTDFINYTAYGTTIRVYGDLSGFDCSQNSTNLTDLTFSSGLTNLGELYCENNSLTTLDVSELTNLWHLVCYSNNFSTLAIDYIYCGLPQRQAGDDAVIQPVYNSSSADIATVLATTTQNAIDKNWKVRYHANNTNLPATTGTYVCPPATPPTGTPYITMTVTSNATMKIRMQAAADNTPVWVETATGSYTTVMVDTGWTNRVSYTADGTTIKVYGNLKGFDCKNNSYIYNNELTDLTFSNGLTNLKYLHCALNSFTSLDVRRLTNLKVLDCGGNNLTTIDISGLTNLEEFMCGSCAVTTLDVSGMTNLKKLYCDAMPLNFDFVSGLTNLEELSCAGNHLTTLDFISGLTNLKVLRCYGNNLTTIDASWLTNLKKLWCSNNNFTTLDFVSGLTNLEELDCRGNNLTTLDVVSGLTNLKVLNCGGNNLTTLDVSELTNLEMLGCYKNSLTALDVSGLTNLKTLYCYGNNFTTQTIDDIYCSLPQRQADDDAVIYPIYADWSDDLAIVLATNKQNAIDKNWKVRYDNPFNRTDLPATAGTYVCVTGIDDVSAAEQLSISPNPAGNTLNIECSEPVQEVRLYNSLGVEVLRTTQSKEINVSHLSKGVYIVSVRTADGTARQKLIKE